MNALTLLALWAASNPAAAATVVRTWCVDINTSYTDNTGSDYWTTNAPREARGMYVLVVNAATMLPDPASNWLDIDGCGDFALDDTKQYHVALKSKAKVNGIEMYAYDDLSTPDLATTVIRTNWTPTAGTSLVMVPSDTLHGQLAVGMWVMYNDTFGLSASNPLEFYDSACCSAGQEIKACTRSLKIIAHEIGHGIGYRRDEETNPLFDYNAEVDNCCGDAGGCPPGGHSLLQKEYQSAAAVEGWADFVAAWAFNDAAGNDCGLDFQGSAADYDLDSNPDANNANVADCENVVANTIADDRDWLADLVAADDDDVDGLQCNGTIVNRGTEYDWMRFFWDMSATENVPVSELADLYDAMNPRTFDDDGGTIWISDDPVYRLEAAASAVGLATEYDNQKNNGVNH